MKARYFGGEVGLSGRLHERDDFGVGVIRDEACGLHIENGRSAVRDRHHVDLAPLVRDAVVHMPLQDIKAERIGLVDFALGAAARATETPEGKLIALLDETEVFGATLTTGYLPDFAIAPLR